MPSANEPTLQQPVAAASSEAAPRPEPPGIAPSTPVKGAQQATETLGTLP